MRTRRYRRGITRIFIKAMGYEENGLWANSTSPKEQKWGMANTVRWFGWVDRVLKGEDLEPPCLTEIVNRLDFARTWWSVVRGWCEADQVQLYDATCIKRTRIPLMSSVGWAGKKGMLPPQEQYEEDNIDEERRLGIRHYRGAKRTM